MFHVFSLVPFSLFLSYLRTNIVDFVRQFFLTRECKVFRLYPVTISVLFTGEDGTEVLFGTSDGRVGLVQIGK